MITSEVIELAQMLWDYHQLHHTVEKAECIFVLGSHDTRVAERGAELFLQGCAPLIVMSGGLGRLTKESWSEPEASLFAKIAIEKGVPADAILVEDKSTNTGENILFTQQLLKQKGLDPEKFILVQKPYMERRSLATFEKQWPGKNLIVTSPQISFKNYPTADLPMERVIQIMVGDLQRIKIYAEKGFQTYQEIPENIWQAFERLVALGFDQQLVKSSI